MNRSKNRKRPWHHPFMPLTSDWDRGVATPSSKKLSSCCSAALCHYELLIHMKAEKNGSKKERSTKHGMHAEHTERCDQRGGHNKWLPQSGKKSTAWRLPESDCVKRLPLTAPISPRGPARFPTDTKLKTRPVQDCFYLGPIMLPRSKWSTAPPKQTFAGASFGGSRSMMKPASPGRPPEWTLKP